MPNVDAPTTAPFENQRIVQSARLNTHLEESAARTLQSALRDHYHKARRSKWTVSSTLNLRTSRFFSLTFFLFRCLSISLRTFLRTKKMQRHIGVIAHCLTVMPRRTSMYVLRTSDRNGY